VDQPYVLRRLIRRKLFGEIPLIFKCFSIPVIPLRQKRNFFKMIFVNLIQQSIKVFPENSTQSLMTDDFMPQSSCHF